MGVTTRYHYAAWGSPATSRHVTNACSRNTGSAIQVMLSEGSCYSKPGAEIERMGGLREHYDTKRGMPTVWIDVVDMLRNRKMVVRKP